MTSEEYEHVQRCLQAARKRERAGLTYYSRVALLYPFLLKDKDNLKCQLQYEKSQKANTKEHIQQL